MTDERYKELMISIGMPDSRSLLQALQQVAMEAAFEECNACIKLLEDDADRQEKVWHNYISSGGKGPATSFHTIPRAYAKLLKDRW